jgi:flavin-dependent dehydrogenase
VQPWPARSFARCRIPTATTAPRPRLRTPGLRYGSLPRPDDCRALFDIAILGGGPAGTAAALTLKQVDPGLRVLLVEATDYRAPRIGETMAPGGQALLQALGCWQRFRAEGFLEAHGTAASWGGPGIHRNEFLLSARGSGWRLNRARFDAMLAECASQARVELHRRTRFAMATREAQTWHLRLATEVAPASIEARFVIDATGRAARFATSQNAQRCREDRLIAISAVYSRAGGYPATEDALLVEADRDGWWYSTVLPDTKLLVAWISDADLVHAAHLRDNDVWDAHLRGSGPTAARISDGVAGLPPKVWPAGSQHLVPVQGDAWVAAGDAVCAWDPLSSAGVLKALRSGRLAAFVALDALRGRPDSVRKYARILQREHTAYLEARTWFYGLEKRWPDAPFWRRRAPHTIGDGP